MPRKKTTPAEQISEATPVAPSAPKTLKKRTTKAATPKATAEPKVTETKVVEALPEIRQKVEVAPVRKKLGKPKTEVSLAALVEEHAEATSDIAEELQSLINEDVSLAFRPRRAVPTVSETPAPTTQVKAVEAAPVQTRKPAPKRSSEPEVWDEELPIPVFRARESAPERPEPRQERTRRERPERQDRSERQDRPERQPRESAQEQSDAPAKQAGNRERSEGRDREGSEPSRALVEFEPTEVIEFDDLVVKMRAVSDAPEAAPVQKPRTRISEREPAPKQEPKPKPEKTILPPRALIDTPTDAPQVVVREGLPTLVRDHKVYPNFWFYAQPQDASRTETILDEVRQAAEAGLEVFALGFDAVCDEHHFNAIANQVIDITKKIVSISRNAQVMIHLNLSASKGWELDYPEGVYRDRKNDLSEPSLSDDKYWKNIETLLRNLVATVQNGGIASNFLGIEIDRDNWLIPESQGFDISLASKRKFREWVRERYQGDEVLLRASWFDGSASFETIRIPDFQNDGLKDQRLIRSDRRERAIVDYNLFLSDITVHRIADLSYAIKEASGGQFLVGVRYGLSLENTYPTSGQLALGKILRTPEIDFVAAAPSYRDRTPGGVASFTLPIDSVVLNGKLAVSLEDFKTSLANRPEPDTQNPVMRTPQALESVHLRGLGAALSHGTGINWSDQWGNGWLTTNSVWLRAKTLRQTLIRAMAANPSNPDVAVFIDERTMGYLMGTKPFTNLVRSVRESVLRAGVSVGFYLLSDLTHREKFPECKVYLFLNAWDIRSDLRSAIKQRLHRDGKLLAWFYTAGVFDSGRETLERAREVTGIAIKPQPIFSKAGTQILDRRNPIAQAFPQASISTDTVVEPTYFAIPEDGSVLGEYVQTGLPSLVVRENVGDETGAKWTSVFLGEPVCNPALIRALAQKAGAHVYSFSDDVVHVRAPFLTVHCCGDGQRTITLPGKWSAYNLQTGEWAVVDSNSLRFTAADGTTMNFLIGPTDEVRRILEADPRQLLHMAELPERESNVRIDVSTFEVPIMRLDEWSNGSDSSDDVGIDDWYLQSHDDDYQEDASLAPGAIQTSTGRRRQGRNRRERKLTLAEQVDFDPTGEEKLKEEGNGVELDILFRRRD